ncbi:AEC family transporter [Tropicimonas sp. TH_r6]|uniref:AEC family transporter n=1 Tax=Tropicimonas sp. TH_r6 TaxID=3082085 RepID=UPI0029536B77|nr:AEC family transporter [Tropicimonas sp. TH_r6]MDV7144669.1 AEC family transporter [Tropicimonas sp. TH_r6]
MLAVLEIIFPIYALIGLSFFLTRRGFFSAEDLRAFGKFMITLGFPALMFTAIARRPLAETIQMSYMLPYALGTLALMALLYPAFRRSFDHKTTTLATMGSTCPNSGFIGYPILLLAMPEIADKVLAQNLVVENMIFLPLIFTLLELGNGGEGSRLQIAGRVFWRVLTGPLVLAMLAGVAVSASGLTLPGALLRPLDMLAAASGALALIVIGGNLALLKPKGVRALAGYIVAGKLLLHPLAIFVAVTLAAMTGLLPLDGEMRAALILTGALPTFGMFPVVAQAHGREGFASAAQFGTTLGALFTLTALLLVLGG